MFRVKAIKKQNLQDFLTKMYNDGFSVNTIASIKGILTKSFTYAVDNHFIMMSPAEKL